jgi:hypothetical protein
MTMKLFNHGLILILLLTLAGPILTARADSTPPEAASIAGAVNLAAKLAAIQAAPTIEPTSAIVINDTPTPVAVDQTSTGLAEALIWAAIAITVAVTLFLIWRTRPRR